ncbi:sensor histidine kinase [Zunongwangia sp.]|uniref:sensor histidine kinase n=1 Tax=Zunongwangia sp. TaxID=1965325 RepID=UPI003AA7D5D2
MNTDFSLEDRLKERVKELSCLYSISNVFRKQTGNIKEALSEVCQITKKAWRHPESAIVQLQFNTISLLTSPIPSSKIEQQSFINDSNGNTGTISVFYNAEEFKQSDFLVEEQQLLDQIAIEISDFLERQAIKNREELLRKKAESNHRLSVLGEITAGIAHELNTPLGNILGFAELIQSSSQENQTKDDIEKIIKASIYSREIVKKLMFFACEMPHNRALVSVKPIIDQALALLAPNLKKAQIDCEFIIDNPELKLPIDMVQFTQVIFNLVINAIYVSEPNTKIEIIVKTNHQEMIMEVYDEGPGIPQELKKKIFNPFFSTKPVGEGSGLGLSVVHGIIKAHQGEICIFDNNPKGSIFQIIIPL